MVGPERHGGCVVETGIWEDVLVGTDVIHKDWTDDQSATQRTELPLLW